MNSIYKICIVEDDIKIRSQLSIFLEKYGYECIIIKKFDNVINELLQLSPDVIILDINLPVYDGYYICRELREKTETPIIIVTSRDNEIDELMGMNLGADDFITKPYNTQILLARIASIIKRTYNNVTDILSYQGLKLNTSQSTVLFNEKQTELTKNENRILSYLMQNPHSIKSRDEIMHCLWQSDQFIDDNTLTVNINRLRGKLKNIGADNFIQTKRGQGYILK